MSMRLDVLERDLPAATLLLGPDVEGMLGAAYRALLKAHLLSKVDTRLLRHVSAPDARNLVRFAQTAPFGPFKAVVAALDGSTPQAQNILLKVLEEPPLLDSGEPVVRFILVAAERPLPTIVSRCQVITVTAGGAAAAPDEQTARQVAAALSAAQSGDLAGLDRALRGWDTAHHSALSLLLAEASAGRDPNRRIDREQARRLLGALSRYDGAHPRLAAHAALVTVLVP